MAKAFDIIINSKYNPAGGNQLEKTLTKSLLNVHALRAGFNLVTNTIERMMRAADPERFAKLDEAMQGLEQAGGRLLNQVLGPLIDKWTEIVKLAGTALGPSSQSQDFFGGWIQNFEKAGVGAEEMAVKLKAMSDAAVDLGQKAKDAGQLPFWINVKDFGINAEQMRAALVRNSRTFEEYVKSLRAAGFEIKNLKDELMRFSQLKGIKLEDPFRPLMQGMQDYLQGMKSLEEQATEFRTDAARDRTQLLQNIAIAEGRRLQDIARQNARALQDIDAQRVSALSDAQTQYNSSIAALQQQTADQRVQIEQNYQDRIRQINESSAMSIEDAIERRDARALSKALQARDQQLGQASRDHDKEQKANEKNLQQQRVQIEQAYREQKAAAERAAQEARDQLNRQNAEAAQEAEIARKRQLEDFNLGKLRELQSLQIKLRDQQRAMNASFQQQQESYRRHLEELARITESATGPGGKLGQAIIDKVNEGLADLFSTLGINYTPVGGGQ